MATGKKKKKKTAADKIKTTHSQQLSFADVDKWEIPPVTGNAVEIASLPSPIWTETKAQLIAHYLRLFLMITKHGAYIDGFAGPQDKSNPESWAAKLVLENEPRRLRHFHLCDADQPQIARLEFLKSSQPLLDTSGKPINRDIKLYLGDFNTRVDEILDGGTITEKEATFCLLDQRTFECNWATVEKLARYKKSGMKIELFYFLANGWFERALSGQKDLERLEKWWGRDDWLELYTMSRDQRPSWARRSRRAASRKVSMSCTGWRPTRRQRIICRSSWQSGL